MSDTALSSAAPTLVDRIREFVHAADADTLFTWTQFEGSSRQTTGSAFRRLESEGLLVKLENGAFCKPLPTAPQARQAALDGVLFALGELVGQTIVSDGAGAAFSLGLLDKAPLRPVFLTTRNERRIEIGRAQVALVEADDWWFELAGAPGGQVIRTLGWAGSSRVQETWAALRTLVPRDVLFAVSLRADHLPLWMREPVLRFR